MVGYCHECKYFKENSNSRYMGYCENTKNIITDLRDTDSSGIYVLVSDNVLNVGMNFGCIHFERNEQAEYDSYDDEEDGWA